MNDPSRLRELFSLYLQQKCTTAEVEELVALVQEAGAEDALSEEMRAIWEQVKGAGTPGRVRSDGEPGRERGTRVEMWGPGEPGMGGRPGEDGASGEGDEPGMEVGAWGQGQPGTGGGNGRAEGGLSGRMRDGMQGYIRLEPDWEAMYKRIGQAEVKTPRIRRVFYPVAALMLLGLLIPAAWWVMIKRESARPRVAKIEQKASLTPAQRRVLHLPDGTTVTLNRNSRLDFAPGLEGKAREVFLTGEAFFDVARASGRPFLVHTGKVLTRVLGTSFNVKTDREQVEITVAAGKVQVTDDKIDKGVLTAAQQVRVGMGATKEEALVKKVDVAAVIAWRPKEVRYEDETLGMIVQDLEKRYGKKVRFVNPAVEQCRVTATFSEDDNMDEILTVVCAISQSFWSVKDDVVTVDGKGCH